MSTRHAYLVDGTRTPIGRYGGALSSVRPDDLAAHVVRALVERLESVDWDALDDTVLGCTNQAGEDNRNVARQAALLADLPESAPGTTMNRLCASALDAVGTAARAVRAGDADLVLAGGVESMSRAPFVIPKAASAFSRSSEIADSTIGWRFVNPKLEERVGAEPMTRTAENVAEEYGVSRADQDAFALRSQQRAAAAIASGRLAREITPVPVPARKRSESPTVTAVDEQPRPSTLEGLGALRPLFEGGTVTAGTACGVGDGAAAVLIASEAAVRRYHLSPLARITGMAAIGVAPRIMGIGPAPVTQLLLRRHGLQISDIDLIEINEAFASQSLASLRLLGLPDDAEHVNPHGGAIALGHPLGMTGARLALTAAINLADRGARRALVTMCVGIGQGVAVLLESAS
jgi:acetyl-CoA C-acetyltransferase